MSAVHTPSLLALFEVAHRLKRGGVKFALGGSGLLHALGLCDLVYDWDITTESSWEQVEACIKGLEYERIPPSGIYATEHFCKINLHGSSVDLMRKFAIRQGDQAPHPISTIVTGYWRGIPLGSPREWSEAYRLMGRNAKADLLAKYMSSRAMPMN